MWLAGGCTAQARAGCSNVLGLSWSHLICARRTEAPRASWVLGISHVTLQPHRSQRAGLPAFEPARNPRAIPLPPAAKPSDDSVADRSHAACARGLGALIPSAARSRGALIPRLSPSRTPFVFA